MTRRGRLTVAGPDGDAAYVEPKRIRCRGKVHKPDCAHLGADPLRERCRGDRHREGCAHLVMRPPGKPGRPKSNRRSLSALARHLARKDDPRPPCQSCSARSTEVLVGESLHMSRGLCMPCYGIWAKRNRRSAIRPDKGSQRAQNSLTALIEGRRAVQSPEVVRESTPAVVAGKSRTKTPCVSRLIDTPTPPPEMARRDRRFRTGTPRPVPPRGSFFGPDAAAWEAVYYGERTEPVRFVPPHKGIHWSKAECGCACHVHDRYDGMEWNPPPCDEQECSQEKVGRR